MIQMEEDQQNILMLQETLDKQSQKVIAAASAPVEGLWWQRNVLVCFPSYVALLTV